MKLYRRLATTLEALANCEKHPDSTVNVQWADRHRDAIAAIMATAPSGSGIDRGVKILDGGPTNRLTFATSYHHMDDGGSYDGWTDHNVVVTPSLAHEITVRITGVDRNEIKEYLGDVLHDWLMTELP